MNFHVIIASHNRRELTVNAVTRAAASAKSAGINVTFTIYDDGSTDGTAQALRELGLPITVVNGTGSAYWARGMSIAEESAMTIAGDRDWIVWMNDDVNLDADAFTRAVEFLDVQPDAVFVATFTEPGSIAVSYGGYRRYSRRHPLHCRLVPPSRDNALAIDTMNGNLVFVPVAAVQRIGGIDGSFAHAAADTDFGLRCVKAGVPLLLLPGTFGSCARETPGYASIVNQWRAFTGIKGGGHPATLRRLLRKHSKGNWALLWISSYILWWVRQLRKRATFTAPKVVGWE